MATFTRVSEKDLEADLQFKDMIKECLKTLRVTNEKKEGMIKILNDDLKSHFKERLRSLSPEHLEKIKKKFAVTISEQEEKGLLTKPITDLSKAY